jgi:hypothetical protein
MGATSWAFLLVGSFAAVGAAMAVGTLAALARYRRTGSFPGDDQPAALTRRRLVALWIRVAAGLLIAGVGIEAIRRAGIF